MYTKQQFGEQLEKKLSENFNIQNISNWAYMKYLDNCLNLEEGLRDTIMTLAIMGDAPEFEYTKDELLEIAKKLQGQ